MMIAPKPLCTLYNKIRSKTSDLCWITACLKSGDEGQSLRWMSRVETSGRGEIAIFLFADQEANNQVMDASHIPGHVGFGHAEVIFMESDIPAKVEAILDAPIGAEVSQESGGRSCVFR